MADTRPPAFQFYARDWLSGKRCRMLRPVERAAHADLMSVQWLDGSIPTDEEELCDLLRGLGNNPDELRLDRLLDLYPGGKNRRLEKEREKQAEYRAKKADAGRKGAKARWQTHGTASGGANAEAKANDGSSSASSTANTSTVVSQPAKADVENALEGDLKWNARLAPLAREAGGEDKVGDWLRWAKPFPDYAEEVLIGLVSLRERGAIEWVVKPGEPMSPAILSVTMDGQPIEQRAIAEYHRLGRMPRGENHGLERAKA